LYVLWQFPIILKVIDTDGQITAQYHCPLPPEDIDSSQV
jgi:hypothetical protein